MKKLVIIIAVVIALSGIVIGCSGNAKEYSYDAEQEQYRDFSDSSDYQRYKRFDVFTLTGQEPTPDTPCVYVKRTEDLIIVKESENVSRSYVFRKLKDCWHYRQERDMEHAFEPDCYCYCEGAPSPMRIDRYIFKDAIYSYIQCPDIDNIDVRSSILIDSINYIISPLIKNDNILRNDYNEILSIITQSLKGIDITQTIKNDTTGAFYSYKITDRYYYLK